MSYLIVPAIEPIGIKPKWLKTHPFGSFMLTTAISGINLDIFDEIIFVFHQDYEIQYQFKKGLSEDLEQLGLKNKSTFVDLWEYTTSQPETVYKALKLLNSDDSKFIFVKDADNYFDAQIRNNNNQVVCYDLKDYNGSDIKNKCYVEYTDGPPKILTNIIEKTIVSSQFSIGGYGFETVKIFYDHYERLPKLEGWPCYMSNVLFEMILQGQQIDLIQGYQYEDWGTDESWQNYTKQFRVIFLDIDGILVTNSSAHFPPYIGNGKPLQNNVDCINKLLNSGKTMIIATTSRPESYREQTTNELMKLGIYYKELIMGLPHCQRILINDFARSNPFPSCTAINLPRNQDNLQEYIK
jgi:hypothetical protein